MIKNCAKCKIDKDIINFSKNKSRKDGYTHHCKECQSSFRKKSYSNNIEYNKHRVKEYKAKIKQKFNDFKSTLSCKICGENHIATLDFHHIDPSEKDGAISRMLHDGSIKKVYDEIEKCDVLCSNCHRKLHYKEDTVH